MKKRVIIIGGGVAGLSAASALVRGDCDVMLLEAKPRLGGRIHTMEEGGCPIELGAEFLHGESQTIRTVIQAAGLSTHDVSDDYRLFKDGRLKPLNLWSKMSYLIHRVDIRGRDRSFRDFLETQSLTDQERAQALGFVQGFHAADPERIGVHSLARGEYAAEHMQDTQQGRINEGYSALVGFMEREIRQHGGKLVTNAVVQAVHWRAGQVRVNYLQGRVQTVEADAALVTLPLGVLKANTVKFEPPLSQKQEAISQLQFGNVIKVVFHFRERWWPDFGFLLALDEPLPTWWTDPRGSLLTGWAGGPAADVLATKTAAELEKLGLEILGRTFPKQAGIIRDQLIATHSHDWAADEHFRGAYSYLPVNGLDLPKLLGAPMANTLFFAGEATVFDAQTGTVFSAYDTGLRAARELLAGN